MNCANHPDVPVAAYCRTCGKALCENCKRDVRGVIYCEDCIAARVQDTVPAAAPVAAAPAAGFAPSPGLAGVLAVFFPFGIGPVYNRQYWKGLVYMLTFAFLVFATSNGRGLEPLFGIGIAFFYFYQIVDSVRTARALQLGQTPPDPLGINRMLGVKETKTDWSAGVPIGAVILIGLGCIFLLNNLGWFHFRGVDDWWPVVLIGLGVWLFFRREAGCTCVRCRCRNLMGPAVLVTLGILFLLNTLGIEDFGATWPLLLIVIGIVKVLQTSGPTTGHVDSTGTGPTGPALPEGEANSHNTEVSNA
ncbi:MAG TPA: B-box zinc finger protein [Terriglobales bacterium]|nr:B-box zinc finger protein [Terriglobales bacterium]